MGYGEKLNFLSLVVTLLCVSFCVVEAHSPFACDPKSGLTRSLKFCATSVPIHVRVSDLIGRLTLQEKIRLLVNNAAAVPRLGIQGYEWWSEALHGVSNVGPGVKFGASFPGATSFPQVITTAASFNESLWEEIGRVRTFPFSCLYIISLLSIDFLFLLKKKKKNSILAKDNKSNLISVS
jgi:hypothetical protein